MWQGETPFTVSGLPSAAVQIAVGRGSFALLDDGSIWAWASGDQSTPAQVDAYGAVPGRHLYSNVQGSEFVVHMGAAMSDGAATGENAAHETQLGAATVQVASSERPAEAGEGHTLVLEGEAGFFPASFSVLSGPCTISDSGRCVGRPGGYLPNEDCDIVVVGEGGTTSGCPVFDLNDNNCQHYCPGDYITLGDTPTSVTQGNGNEQPFVGTVYTNGGGPCSGPGGGGCDVGHLCPAGVTLATDDHVRFHSDSGVQGSRGLLSSSHSESACAERGDCGLPWSSNGLGGGWQICF